MLQHVHFLLYYRAEEEAAGRAKAEKEKRDLQALLQETQDDLESEKEGRMKAEKQKRQVNDVSHWEWRPILHYYILHYYCIVTSSDCSTSPTSCANQLRGMIKQNNLFL